MPNKNKNRKKKFANNKPEPELPTVSFIDEEEELKKKEKKAAYSRFEKKRQLKNEETQKSIENYESDSESETENNKLKSKKRKINEVKIASEPDYDADDEEPKKKKPKKDFASSFESILSREIQDIDPILYKNKTGVKRIKQEKLERQLKKQEQRAKQLLKDQFHVQPVWTNAEKKLMNTTRKGVVQLFNAVYKQQKSIHEQTKDSTFTKFEPLDKNKFLQLLQGDKTENVSKLLTVERKEQPEQEATNWNVLKDDFLLERPNLQDWDNASKSSSDEEIDYSDDE